MAMSESAMPQEEKLLQLLHSEEDATAPAIGGGPPPYLNIPGVRFIPTDTELIVDYLWLKLCGEQLPTDIVRVCDVYSGHPGELTSNLGSSIEGYWYMFSPRARKYRKGGRPSRSTNEAGFWKGMNSEDKILGAPGEDGTTPVIGLKRPLTYHEYECNPGEKPAGKNKTKTKTVWKMWEYVCFNTNRPFTSEAKPMLLNDWVLCKVTNKQVQRRRQGRQVLQQQQQTEEAEASASRSQEEEQVAIGSSQVGEVQVQQETLGPSLSGGDDEAAAAAEPAETTPWQAVHYSLFDDDMDLHGAAKKDTDLTWTCNLSAETADFQNQLAWFYNVDDEQNNANDHI